MEDEYLFSYSYSGEMQYGIRHRWLISIPISADKPYLSPVFYYGHHLLRMEVRQTGTADREVIDFMLHLLRYDGDVTFDMELSIMSPNRRTFFGNQERTVGLSKNTTMHIVKEIVLLAKCGFLQRVIVEATFIGMREPTEIEG